MPLSLTSIHILQSCEKPLHDLVTEVSKKFSIIVLCGHRGEKEQNEAVAKGASKVKWPNSAHNRLPSRAVDIAPYTGNPSNPVDWQDVRAFYYLAGYVRGVAERMGVKVRIGADWDGDFNLKDQNFNDLPHIELEA